MRLIDIEAMIELLKTPEAPVMLCQTGYVFVNNHNLSHRPQIQNQINERLDNSIICEVPQCSKDGVTVYCMMEMPKPPERIKSQERAKLYTLNITPNKT